MIPHFNENGYLQVGLMTETGRVFRKVHRLVLIVYDFNPKYEILQGNHKDGIKSNCHLSNLEWNTPKENKNHAIINKLSSDLIGENNPNSVLTELQVLAIADMLLKGYSKEDILKVIPVANISMIRDISNGRTWRYLFTDETIKIMYNAYMNTISEEDKHKICQFYQDNYLNYNGYGSVIKIVTDALVYLNIDINDRNLRIAKRLFYRYDNPEITQYYKYGKFND